MYSLSKKLFLSLILLTPSALLQSSTPFKHLRQTTLDEYFKPHSKEVSHKRPASCSTAEDADDEDDEDDEEKNMPLSKDRKKNQPLLLSLENRQLTDAIQASCNNTYDQAQLRCQVYDLLNSAWPALPDQIFISFRDIYHIRHRMSLLSYALFFCQNEDIIRLLAEKSSHETKRESLTYDYVTTKLKTNTNLRDPYFSYFFTVPTESA
jgi:hypothetical protein